MPKMIHNRQLRGSIALALLAIAAIVRAWLLNAGDNPLWSPGAAPTWEALAQRYAYPRSFDGVYAGWVYGWRLDPITIGAVLGATWLWRPKARPAGVIALVLVIATVAGGWMMGAPTLVTLILLQLGQIFALYALCAQRWPVAVLLWPVVSVSGDIAPQLAHSSVAREGYLTAWATALISIGVLWAVRRYAPGTVSASNRVLWRLSTGASAVLFTLLGYLNSVGREIPLPPYLFPKSLANPDDLSSFGSYSGDGVLGMLASRDSIVTLIEPTQHFNSFQVFAFLPPSSLLCWALAFVSLVLLVRPKFDLKLAQWLLGLSIVASLYKLIPHVDVLANVTQAWVTTSPTIRIEQSQDIVFLLNQDQFIALIAPMVGFVLVPLMLLLLRSASRKTWAVTLIGMVCIQPLTQVLPYFPYFATVLPEDPIRMLYLGWACIGLGAILGILMPVSPRTLGKLGTTGTLAALGGVGILLGALGVAVPLLVGGEVLPTTSPNTYFTPVVTSTPIPLLCVGIGLLIAAFTAQWWKLPAKTGGNFHRKLGETSK